jgi:MFS family permease
VSFGDAFLYPYLPVNSVQLGIPVAWVGLLLSINRFIRIIANSLMTRLFALYGLRSVTISAVILAILSTAGYSVAVGILTWVVFRIFWGLSFSALRISIIGYALEQQKQGLTLGIGRSVQELGPLLTLFLAPVIIQYISPKLIFIFLATASLPALYFSIKLPITHDRPVLPKMKFRLRLPSTLNAITFTSAFLIDGVLIVSLGILFLQRESGITPLLATSLAAGYLAYRRICSVGLSTVGGWIADKIGFKKVLIISLLFIMAGLSFVISGWLATGTAVVCTFYSMSSTIAPGSASHQQQSHLVAAAENATWRDTGAAIGTLTGGFLLIYYYLFSTLLIATFGLLMLFLVQIGSVHEARKVLYS